MKYSVRDLRVDFPNEEACLAWLVDWINPNGITCKRCQIVTKHYRLRNRKVYSCGVCGTQVSPMKGTIFEGSHMPLFDWFYVMYLLATNKAGVSAMQIQRQLSCSYKTAWRMLHKIRSIMYPPEQVGGEVEIDETYIHANVFKRSSAMSTYGPTGNRRGEVLFGMVQRNGSVIIIHVPAAGTRILTPLIRKHIKPASLIHSDGYIAYRKLPNWGYQHRWTDHGKMEFYREDSYTQNIENVWSHLKRGIKGIYRHVSSDYLQLYADEFAWRYSHRNSVSAFWLLMMNV